MKLFWFQVNQSLLDLHKASDGDAHLCDFLEAEYLGEQVDGIKEISCLITKMKNVGPGLGWHTIDKELAWTPAPGLRSLSWIGFIIGILQ